MPVMIEDTLSFKVAATHSPGPNPEAPAPPTPTVREAAHAMPHSSGLLLWSAGVELGPGRPTGVRAEGNLGNGSEAQSHGRQVTRKRMGFRGRSRDDDDGNKR